MFVKHSTSVFISANYNFLPVICIESDFPWQTQFPTSAWVRTRIYVSTRSEPWLRQSSQRPYWNIWSRLALWWNWVSAVLSLYTAIQDLYASDCNRHSTWDSAKSGRQVVSLLLLGKMSPTDAKRGAKRRKNKRGGGSSCSAVCNTSGGKAGVASALGCEGTAAPASVVGFLTPGSAGSGNIGSITGINDEVRVSHYWMSKQGRAAWSVINDTSDLGPRLMRGRQLAS